MNPQQFDAIIIGAGQGGSLALFLAEAGKTVALIDKSHVGGTCVNRGCTPTKTLIACAHAAHLARRGGDFGLRVSSVEADMSAVMDIVRGVVEAFRGDVRHNLDVPGLHLIHGEARFVGQHEIEAGGAQLTSDTIVIAVGARNAVPKIEGLDETPFLDSTSALELEELPAHLLILGGGYIACEYGQAFHHLGARVTLIEQGPQLLPREDPDVAQTLADILREDGLDVRLDAEATHVRQQDGGVALTVKGPQGAEVLRGSHLLVAVGRQPETDALNLQAAGVETDDEGHVRANEQLETSVPGIYALGDVAGSPAFTHIARHDAHILRDNLLHGAKASTRGRMVPYVVFTNPQLGRIGMSEQEAREAGKNFRVVQLPCSEMARPVEMREPRGFWKALVEAESDLILGAALLSVEGGEAMTALQLAMQGGLTAAQLRELPMAHPTLCESFNRLFGAAGS